LGAEEEQNVLSDFGSDCKEYFKGFAVVGKITKNKIQNPNNKFQSR
jgi:hypothetical protein